ncbi:hypothetical protein [Streptomyces sp. NRRL F-5123]|uniref:hypothetical protein n=1 Tax=Streptomyces sp. NRRL F-5123 TaxID=1463856 RepID=UPI0004E24D69|nr:hypothetical protein [Streptomyces sp. NRRL F-5123]
MVTSHHEASHRIFQERPELLTPVFDLLGVRLPQQAVTEVLTPDVTEIRPLERRVDTVLRVSGPGGESPLLLAIEAQQRRDLDKPVSWAYYVAYLQAKYRCPALFLVVCQDKSTADWAAGPFRLGLDDWCSLSVHPLVLGPGNVPVVLDVSEASANLPMAAFSALTHGRDPDAPAILRTLATALAGLDTEGASYYAEMLEIGLGETPAREVWRKLMTVRSYFPGRGSLVEQVLLRGEAQGLAEGLKKGRAEGLEEGLERGLKRGVEEGFERGRVEALQHERARMVITVLQHRGFEVSVDMMERVLGCDDPDLLDRWFKRALDVEVADDIFAEGD